MKALFCVFLILQINFLFCILITETQDGIGIYVLYEELSLPNFLREAWKRVKADKVAEGYSKATLSNMSDNVQIIKIGSGHL